MTTLEKNVAPGPADILVVVVVVVIEKPYVIDLRLCDHDHDFIGPHIDILSSIRELQAPEYQTNRSFQ